jgi:hypothetical protein
MYRPDGLSGDVSKKRCIELLAALDTILVGRFGKGDIVVEPLEYIVAHQHWKHLDNPPLLLTADQKEKRKPSDFHSKTQKC